MKERSTRYYEQELPDQKLGSRLMMAPAAKRTKKSRDRRSFDDKQ